MVESQPSKLLVAGSIPVSRSIPSSNLERPEFHGLYSDYYVFLFRCLQTAASKSPIRQS